MAKKIFIYLLILITIGGIAGGLYFWRYNSSKSLAPARNISNTNNPIPKEEADISLQSHGSAPEFIGIERWFNSDPVKIESLRGKVVLVNFWTYSCINCIQTFPYITKWYEDYKDRGFVVIGVHTPEFTFEKVTANVEAAIKRYNISYPIAQDNAYKTWTAYHNQFWPTYYLIDKDGAIVYTHFGEGKYENTEKAIRTLLGLEGPFDIAPAATPNQSRASEIYFGLARLTQFGGSEQPSNKEQIFTYPKKLAKNKFALEGHWKFTQEAAIHTKGFGRIKLNYDAAKVHVVAQSSVPTTIKIYVDGQLIKGVVINQSDLYQLFEGGTGNHTMEIEIPEGGFEAFTFTFE